MRTIFLSYRRSDTGGEAGRLADSFQQRLGGALVFRDVADIPLGAEFDAELDKELAAAKIVLVLIGPAWLTELQQRQKEAGIDYVRVEVAAALARKKRVIPVLLKGAALPSARDLPEDLGSLAKHQAMTLRDECWYQDVDRLIGAIGRPYHWRFVALRAVNCTRSDHRGGETAGAVASRRSRQRRRLSARADRLAFGPLRTGGGRCRLSIFQESPSFLPCRSFDL